MIFIEDNRACAKCWKTNSHWNACSTSVSWSNSMHNFTERILLRNWHVFAAWNWTEKESVLNVNCKRKFYLCLDEIYHECHFDPSCRTSSDLPSENFIKWNGIPVRTCEYFIESLHYSGEVSSSLYTSMHSYSGSAYYWEESSCVPHTWMYRKITLVFTNKKWITAPCINKASTTWFTFW